MIYKSIISFALIGLFTITTSFHSATEGEAINWISFEEAVKIANEPGNNKKIFIDVYTDWCGWCKVMDKKTFQHPTIAKYMTENFLMVKFDAEQKEDIVFKDHTFKFVPSGRKGYHELAAALLQGEMSYPSVLFMDDKFAIITKLQGFQQPNGFYPIARYIGDDKFKDTKWEDFQKTFVNPL